MTPKLRTRMSDVIPPIWGFDDNGSHFNPETLDR